MPLLWQTRSLRFGPRFLWCQDRYDNRLRFACAFKMSKAVVIYCILCLYCSVLQCVAACCNVLQYVQGGHLLYSMLQCIVVRYIALFTSSVTSQQCVAVCCSVLQCAAVCCSVLQCGHLLYSIRHSDCGPFDAFLYLERVDARSN